MKITSLVKLLTITAALLGLMVGCAGSETKDEAPAEQPAVTQEDTATTAATDEAASAEAEQAATTDDATTTESAAMTTEESPAMESGADSYEVNRGDNLWNISGKGEIYADPYQWPLIYKANRDKIRDADLIYPGQVFDIDRSASQADIDAATNHAKTRGAWTLGEVEASDTAYLGE